MAKRPVTVWDLPLRLFHWGLVVSLTGGFLAVQSGDMELHERFGFVTATLIMWRVIWGAIGSSTARFSDFVRGPAGVIAYIRTGDTGTLGHSPLGGLAVIGMLAVVAAQAGTGLFANDDIFFDGPWAGVVGNALSDRITGLHAAIQNILLAVVLLHIAAIIWYAATGRNLLPPMISGSREVAEDTPAPEPQIACPTRAVAALAVALVLTGALFRYWIL